MAYEFKKLSDVNVIEAMKDGLNVLVEDGGEIVKLAANSMIPEDVALKSDIVLAPTVASVGQTIVVKSVDESGKPTEWEAMDMSAGGGMTLAYNGGFDTYMHHTLEGAYNRSEDDIWTLQELSNIAQSQMIAIGGVDEADGAFYVAGIEYLEDAVFTADPSYGYVTSIIGNRYYTVEYTGAPS